MLLLTVLAWPPHWVHVMCMFSVLSCLFFCRVNVGFALLSEPHICVNSVFTFEVLYYASLSPLRPSLPLLCFDFLSCYEELADPQKKTIWDCEVFENSCSPAQDKWFQPNRWMAWKLAPVTLFAPDHWCAFSTNCLSLSLFTACHQCAEVAQLLWRHTGGIKQALHADDSLTGLAQGQYRENFLLHSQTVVTIIGVVYWSYAGQQYLSFQGETFLF